MTEFGFSVIAFGTRSKLPIRRKPSTNRVRGLKQGLPSPERADHRTDLLPYPEAVTTGDVSDTTSIETGLRSA